MFLKILIWFLRILPIFNSRISKSITFLLGTANTQTLNWDLPNLVVISNGIRVVISKFCSRQILVFLDYQGIKGKKELKWKDNFLSKNFDYLLSKKILFGLVCFQQGQIREKQFFLILTIGSKCLPFLFMFCLNKNLFILGLILFFSSPKICMYY